MHRVRLTLQYDGSAFAGWELQPGRRTVRGELERSLAKIYHSKISVSAVSRTDSGAHAVDQRIYFRPPKKFPPLRLLLALNALLPEDIRVVEVGEGKKAKEKVRGKTYEYLIYNGKIIPPHLRKLAWHVKLKLNLTAMKKAASSLIGKRDFSSFCAAGSNDTDFIRTIHSLDIGHLLLVIWGDRKFKLIKFKITGDGFLYKMIRNIVGTLVDVGLGKYPPQKVKEILEARDRRLAGRCAPGQGLCLVNIKY